MVAAAMLVAMSVPAYAQQLVPNGQNDETLNFALALLEQECTQANVSVIGIDQKNEQEIDQEQEIEQSGLSQSGQGFIVINNNDGDVDTVNVADQDQEADQEADNEADVDVEQENEEQECVAAVLQLQDLLDFNEGRPLNGGPQPNGA